MSNIVKLSASVLGAAIYLALVSGATAAAYHSFDQDFSAEEQENTKAVMAGAAALGAGLVLLPVLLKLAGVEFIRSPFV